MNEFWWIRGNILCKDCVTLQECYFSSSLEDPTGMKFHTELAPVHWVGQEVLIPGLDHHLIKDWSDFRFELMHHVARQAWKDI